MLKRIMKRTIIVLACVAALCRASGAGAQSDQSSTGLFGYDDKAPIDLKVNSVESKDGIALQDVSYNSPKGGRVTSYLIVPAGRGPFPAVIFMHWGQGNKTAFLAEALLYARAGAVSLLIDAPFERPEQWYKPLGVDINNPENDRAVYIQSVIDLRRAIDLLASHKEVDAKRIGYVGLSFGGHVGGVLAAVDKRVKTYILMGGPASATDMLRTEEFAGLVQFRKSLPKEKFEAYLKQLEPLDAINFIGKAAPSSVFFQFANRDKFISRRQAERYVAATSTRKQVEWYDVGHEFNDIESLRDRGEWLQKEIGIRPVREILLRGLTSKGEK
jgi:cephalosporin-C deacetylase-like acetyl esterase